MESKDRTTQFSGEAEHARAFRVCLVNTNTSKKIIQDIYQVLFENTEPITENGLEVIEEPENSDLFIVLDTPKPTLAELAKMGKRMVLLTVQPRNKMSLDQYLAGCRSACKENWNKVKVVNIDTTSQERPVQKYWDLHLAVFSLSQQGKLES